MKVPNKTQTISLKVTRKEQRAWRVAAVSVGKRLSAWIRDAANEAVKTVEGK